MLALPRQHTASNSGDRFAVGLPAASAAGDGSDRGGLLKGKDLGSILTSFETNA